MKTVNLPKELHTKLKLKATERGITITQLLVEIITKYLSTFCLLLFVSCASTYTKVDEVNYDRYEHDQKIADGMEMREVMEKFGSPHQVKKDAYNGEYVTKFVYYRAIQCSNLYCFVYFDEDDKEVIKYDGFRQEYINFLD